MPLRGHDRGPGPRAGGAAQEAAHPLTRLREELQVHAGLDAGAMEHVDEVLREFTKGGLVKGV